MMAMAMDRQQQPQRQQQQQVYKHYCRICKKGFGCGRALGGHMRAHGINDVDTLGPHCEPDDDPPSSEWDEKLSPQSGHKRMYALRTNPNRLKSCRVCENCGKEFLSWKSFLEHGKCSSGREDAGDDSLVSSPRSDADADDPVRGCAGWSKGKRSRRAKASVPAGSCPSSEEEDLANCLVMLSAARVDPIVIVETEESCASASKDEGRRQQPIAVTGAADKSKAPALPPPALPRGMFECKACKKVFSSHQALGGHRASHKKVRGCFAAKLDDLDEAPTDDEVITHDHSSSEMAMALAIVPFDDPPLAVTPLKKKSKVHECSICHRVFTSGQALGGHKRCHWITSNAPDPGAIAKLHPSPPGHAAAGRHPQLRLRPMFESSDALDLNLPAPMEDLAGVRQDIGSPLLLDVPAALYLQPWIDHGNDNTNTNTNKNRATTSSSNDKNNDDDDNNNNKNNVNSRDRDNEAITNVNVDDEVDSKVKLAKLSDLKDICNLREDSSPWLQVGIGSSTNEGSEP